jgi:hypothetical protein
VTNLSTNMVTTTCFVCHRVRFCWGACAACAVGGMPTCAFTVNGAVCSATLGHLDQDTGELRCQTLGVGPDLVDCCGKVGPQGDGSRIRACAVSPDAQGQGSAGEPFGAPIDVAEVLLRELRGRLQVREGDAEMDLWHWPVI